MLVSLKKRGVPSPQRRFWWHTLTGARSLSASPWCLCRSPCHRASTCSTSPGSQSNSCFTSRPNFICIHAALRHRSDFYDFLQVFLGRHSLPTEALSHNITSNLPPDSSACEPFLSNQNEICFVLVFFFSLPRSRIHCKWVPHALMETSFALYCFFILTSITWKWV